MNIGLRYREFLRGISGWLEAELDHITTTVSAWSDNVTTQDLTAATLTLNGAAQPVQRIAWTTSNFSVTSSATIQNVTGLSHTVVAGKTYAFEAVLFMTAGAAGGYRLDINGTCTASHLRYHMLVIDNDADVLLIASTESVLGTNRAGANPVSATAVIRGTISVQVSGVLRVGFAQAGASGTASVVERNSRWLIQELV